MDILLDFRIMVIIQFLRLRDLGKYPLPIKGCMLWNDLPLSIRKINGLREFINCNKKPFVASVNCRCDILIV